MEPAVIFPKLGEAWLPYQMRCVVSASRFKPNELRGIDKASVVASRSAEIALFLQYAKQMAYACGYGGHLPHNDHAAIIWLPTPIRHEMTPAIVFNKYTKHDDERQDNCYIVSMHNVFWHGAFSEGYSAEPVDDKLFLNDGIWIQKHEIVRQK